MGFLRRWWPSAVAAVLGTACGAGMLWWTFTGAGPRDPAVRALRLPCNLVALAQVEAVLPGAMVVAVDQYGDPSTASSVQAGCAYARERTAAYELELKLKRYTRQTSSGRNAPPDRTAAERASAAYKAAVDGEECISTPVPGIGDRASGCRGERLGNRYYRVTAVRGDLLMTVVLRSAAGQSEPLHRLAASLVEAVR